ncbi:FadR/GntR family transcriptional regulator [Ancylobacter aquaticus]|uniref:FadR/GntR family transcriptional regulator n=1 Tax=Ancylobacter aquaticus TaxID=100 RepID=UPI001A9EE255
MGVSEAIISVAKQLTAWIETGRYPLHTRLPPERQLAEMLRVSRASLREALQLLENDGRIWRRVGVGTFVGGSPRSVGSQLESLGSATTLPAWRRLRHCQVWRGARRARPTKVQRPCLCRSRRRHL